jgi:fructose-1,6-bisphosphatase/inositol monophosphatase family enzyme
MKPGSPWWSVDRVGEQDIGRQLRLIGSGAWAMFALYGAVIVALTYVFDRPTRSAVTDIVAIVTLLAGALLIVSPSRTPLPAWRVVAVLVLALTAVTVLTVREPFHGDLPDSAAWYQAAANFLFFGLALRSRVVSAWIGEALMIGFVCGWSTIVSGSPIYGISISYGQPISLAAGTVFAVALHQTARRINEFRTAERERAAREAREAAQSAAVEDELRIVRELAGPTLQQIAAGEKPDQEDAKALEAALRDLIRGRSLAIEPLNTALWEARHRGVDIVVLDDSADLGLSTEGLRKAAARCAQILTTVSTGSITIRLASAPPGGILTVVNEHDVRHEWLIASR